MRNAYHLALLALSATACSRDDVAGPARDPRPQPRQVSAVAEITFSDIGTPQTTGSALVASSVAELTVLHARRAGSSGPRLDLTLPANAGGQVGDATIQLWLLSAGTITANGTVYVHATFRVRNAQRTDSAAFNTPRRNLTFVAVATANTIDDTPVLLLQSADGRPADPALARQLLPTGLVGFGDADNPVPLSPDVFQVLTEAEVAAAPRPTGVTNVFPYGYVVHRTGSTTTRTLGPSPTPDTFDGVVTFAYRMPLAGFVANNVRKLTVMMLALDDAETRVTQSLEEQNPRGADGARQRAVSLGAELLRLLPGGSIPGLSGIATETICSVRTAGPTGAATASLVDVHGDFVSLAPDPYSAAGSFVATLSNFAATFSQNVTDVGPTNFIVRGPQSGQAFRGATYKNNGSVVTTPAGSFIPSEEIEVVLTSRASCPESWAGRLRVRTPVESSGTLGPLTTIAVGDEPRGVAIGKFNGDAFLDLVTANTGSRSVTVLAGNGSGGFTPSLIIPVSGTPRQIATGDLNGDGILDLATAISTPNAILVMLGNGDGTFGTAHSFALSGAPAQFVLGDLNADGALDIAAAIDALNANTLAVLMGNGNGTFQPQVSMATQSGPNSVAVGDVNADGILDLAVSNDADVSVSVFRGRGDGTFAPQPAIDVPGRPNFVAIGDVNRDGRPDLVVPTGSRNLTVLLGSGNGTFQPGQPIAAAQDAQPSWVALGDLNGDGILDIVTANQPGSNNISVLRGIGDGRFVAFQEVDSGRIGPEFVALTDLNRDGIVDLVIGNGQNNNNLIGIYLGRP